MKSLTYIYFFTTIVLLTAALPAIAEERLNPVNTPCAPHDLLHSRPTVATLYGRLEGISTPNNTNAWLGIPYAQSPTGILRWKAPRKLDKWKGIKIAGRFANPCAQPDIFSANSGENFGSEDCLYLNIWRPNNSKNPSGSATPGNQHHDLPVFFWIHGGGNICGSGSSPLINGAGLAAGTRMLVVSVNYRLGPLGWFCHPALRHGENAADDSGNYGLLDIIAALEWVQENIMVFGGNPNNVTIAGESAGASDILSLLTSPLASGLFHKAIVESGSFSTNTVIEEDRNAGNLILKLLTEDGSAADQHTAKALLEGMNTIEIEKYLRAKTWHELLAVAPDRGVAAEDGTVIPQQARRKIATGDYNRVPIIIGSNQSELSFFAYKLYNGLVEKYGQLLGDTFYKKGVYYGSLLWKVRGVDELAADMSRFQDKVYAYLFTWDEEPYPNNLLLGAAHALEIPFIFDSFDQMIEPFKTMAFNNVNLPGRRTLSNVIRGYWSEFARTGKPGGAALPEWDSWKSGSPYCLVLDTNVAFSTNQVTREKLFIKLATETSSVQKAVKAYLNKLNFY